MMDFQPINNLIDEINSTTNFLSGLIFTRLPLAIIALAAGVFIIIIGVF